MLTCFCFGAFHNEYNRIFVNLFYILFKEATGVVEEEKAKVRAVLRRIFPEVVVDDALDQGAFLSEFETKALQVATQTAQPAKPEVVEVVKVSSV